MIHRRAVAAIIIVAWIGALPAIFHYPTASIDPEEVPALSTYYGLTAALAIGVVFGLRRGASRWLGAALISLTFVPFAWLSVGDLAILLPLVVLIGIVLWPDDRASGAPGRVA